MRRRLYIINYIISALDLLTHIRKSDITRKESPTRSTLLDVLEEPAKLRSVLIAATPNAYSLLATFCVFELCILRFRFHSAQARFCGAEIAFRFISGLPIVGSEHRQSFLPHTELLRPVRLNGLTLFGRFDPIAHHYRINNSSPLITVSGTRREDAELSSRIFSHDEPPQQ